MTAKDLFLSGDHAKRFGEITADPAFEHALHAAMLTVVEQTPRVLDVAQSWDAHAQILGAMKFMAALRTIHQTQATQKWVAWPNLQPQPDKERP